MNQEVNLETLEDIPEEAKSDIEVLEKKNIKSLLMVPIYGIERISGAFGIGSKEEISKWTKDERSSVKLLAQIFSSAFQRKEALVRVDEKELVYQSILDLSEEAFSISDDNYKIVYCNKKFATMLGYKPEEIIELKIFDIIDKDFHEELHLQAEKRNKGLEDMYEMLFVAKNGEKVRMKVCPKLILGKDGERKGSYSRFEQINK